MKLYRIDETKTEEARDAYTIGRGAIPGGVLIEVEPVDVFILCSSRCGGMGEHQMEGGLVKPCKSCDGEGSVSKSVVIVDDTE